MADYLISPDARIDLNGVWDYIAKDNLSAADRVLQEIRETMAFLAENPELGHIRKDLTSRPVRFWRIYSYLIVYSPETRPMEVVRVLSGYRDVASLLK
jgi:plasmid stabilization system protein ParE